MVPVPRVVSDANTEGRGGGPSIATPRIVNTPEAPMPPSGGASAPPSMLRQDSAPSVGYRNEHYTLTNSSSRERRARNRQAGSLIDRQTVMVLLEAIQQRRVESTSRGFELRI